MDNSVKFFNMRSFIIGILLGSFPIVPPPIVETARGPWLEKQSPKIVVDDFILGDLKALWELEVKYGIKGGIVIEKLLDLQKPLDELDLNFPEEWYSVLCIPEICNRFKVIKRLYFDKTPLGTPVFCDVRHCFGDPEEVKKWHLSLLEEDFEKVDGRSFPVFLGRGDRNQEVYDPSHGFSVLDRGILLSFIETGDAFYVLYVDVPWEVFEKHRDKLLSVVPLQK